VLCKSGSKYRFSFISVGKCNKPINLILVLDNSNNLDDFQFKQAKRFMNFLLNVFDASETASRAALVTITSNGKYKILSKLSDRHYLTTLKDKINNIKHEKESTGTHLVYALENINEEIVKDRDIANWQKDWAKVRFTVLLCML